MSLFKTCMWLHKLFLILALCFAHCAWKILTQKLTTPTRALSWHSMLTLYFSLMVYAVIYNYLLLKENLTESIIIGNKLWYLQKYWLTNWNTKITIKNHNFMNRNSYYLQNTLYTLLALENDSNEMEEN